ncbi:MAG: 50S ribosomal protein L9 [Deltaproteobacteria bacterium]|jgi:large subunit ribosomal protein L9|nr:50S ribosomal protein L9 [Deltaproteobacteria bacterium]MBW2541905.1 50S ribosomal protein L9 [Deltaproteobacteria bacterium]
MRQVKVILREAVLGLGEAGDLVGVKVGYARNYLLPQGKALLATDSKVRELEHHKRVVMEKAARDLKDLKALCERLESVELEVTAKVGEEGKLFGSITSSHIADLLAEKGYTVDRRKITLSEPLREVGDHVVPIRLQRDLTANVALKISAES